VLFLKSQKEIDMDNFKFITNITNPCGDAPTLEDFVAKVLKKEAAGEACPEDAEGKKCGEGQVISDKGEAGEGHQDGESVKGKTKEAAGKAKAEDCPGEGIPISLDASEEFQKGESTDGSKVNAKNKKTEAKVDKKVKVAKKDAACKKCECNPCECKKEASSNKWTKISNLSPKSKKMLRNFWLTQYPREYVDAMIQDR